MGTRKNVMQLVVSPNGVPQHAPHYTIVTSIGPPGGIQGKPPVVAMAGQSVARQNLLRVSASPTNRWRQALGGFPGLSPYNLFSLPQIRSLDADS